MTATSEQPNSAVCLEQAAKPDSAYYHSDGDLEILVDNTLFKVHHILFARLGIDVPTTATSLGEQHTKKADIVVLNNISLDDFRALCWAVYLLPGDPPPGVDDVDRMLRIASVSHTFGITNLLIWAGEYLTNEAECIAGLPALERPGWDPGFLSRLLRVCTTCGLSDAARNFEDIWISRLAAKDLAAFPEALTTADDLRLRRFQGYAFYYLLIAAADNDANRIPPERATLYDVMGISHEQRDRLSDGAYSLSVMAHKLHPIIRCFGLVRDTADCDKEDHDRVCMPLYQACIDRALGYFPPLPFDVLGQLDSILMELRDEEKLHSSCRDLQIQRIEWIREQAEAGLADHFTSAIDLRLRTSVG